MIPNRPLPAQLGITAAERRKKQKEPEDIDGEDAMAVMWDVAESDHEPITADIPGMSSGGEDEEDFSPAYYLIDQLNNHRRAQP